MIHIIFLLSLVLVVPAHAQKVLNSGTQDRNSAAAKFNLRQEIVSELSGVHNKTAARCFDLISSPKIDFLQNAEVQVKKDGRLMRIDADQIASVRVAQTLACSVALGRMADPLVKKFTGTRPTRDGARAEIRKHLTANFEPEFKRFIQMNEGLADVGVRVEPGNLGSAKPYIRFNDVEVYGVIRNESGNTPAFEIVQNGGENSLKEKGSLIREIIYGGIYAWSTLPTPVSIPCPAGWCAATLTSKFDGQQLVIHRDSTSFFDQEHLDGAVYSVELSGERTIGTMKKIER